MALTIQIELTPEAQATLRSFQTLPPRMLEKMRSAMDEANQLVLGQVTAKRFTGRGPFPPPEHRLGVRTGRLRQSLRASKAEIAGNSIQSAIGSNVVYLAMHELGFTGQVNVKSFTRRVPTNRFGRAPRSPLKIVRGKKSSPSTETVRAHTRNMNVPARAPLRTGIEENLDIYRDKLSTAVLESMKE
jgi:hypothetical protein